MRRTYTALAFLLGCSVSASPAPEPKPAPKPPAPYSELSDSDEGGWNACDKADVVVINGHRFQMPVLCSPDYFYGGDPPPDSYVIDRAVPDGR